MSRSGLLRTFGQAAPDVRKWAIADVRPGDAPNVRYWWEADIAAEERSYLTHMTNTLIYINRHHRCLTYVRALNIIPVRCN